MKKIWINSGELSGDIHGAALLNKMKKIAELEAIGMGGEYLAKAGQNNLLHIKDLSVMGGVEILSILPRIFKMLRLIKQELIKHKPDAIILIDAPEFNFKVAKIAKDLNIPVYYYIPPKVWAWRTYRVKFLKKFVKDIFCILPFEPEFYKKHGLETTFCGNPLVDIIDAEKYDNVEVNENRISIMPGSRKKEISTLMPEFAKCAQILKEKYDKLEFYCLRAPNISKEELQKLWNCEVELNFVEPENRYEAIKSSYTILAASGTACLETAIIGTPTVIAYKISPISAFIAKHLIAVKWAGLPNLIMNEEIFPEYLQENATGLNMANQISSYIEDKKLLAKTKDKLKVLREKCGEKNSVERVSKILLQKLEGN